MVAVADRRGPHRHRVAARLGLGQRVGEHRLAAGDRRQVALEQVLRGRQQQRHGAELVDGRDQRGRRAGPRDLLDHDAGGQRVGAGAAVLLGDVHRVEVGLAQRVVGLLRELALLVDLGGVRGDLVVADGSDRLAQHLVLVGQPEQVEVAHRSSLRRRRVGPTSGHLGSLPRHDPAPECPRHRLPRRHARRLHGRARLRRHRHGRRRGQGGHARRRPDPRSTSPTSSRSCARAWRAAGSGSPRRTPRQRPPTCTSSAWGPPSARVSTPPTCATSTVSSTAWRRTSTGRRLVVGKSTVPVGTAARLQQRLAELAPAGEAAELAWNPEFLREGFAVEDTLQARPARRRHRVGAGRGAAARGLRQRDRGRRRRSSSPTTPPPSW